MIIKTRKKSGKQRFTVLNHLTGETWGPYDRADAEDREGKLQRQLMSINKTAAFHQVEVKKDDKKSNGRRKAKVPRRKSPNAQKLRNVRHKKGGEKKISSD